MEIRYMLPLLAVRSVERAKAFYGGLFGQTVTLDLGKNVTFSGGFAVQEDFSWLIGLAEQPSYQKSCEMELYFETDDFDAFLEKLAGFPEAEMVHAPKKYDWQQRVVRFYDPDGHMIEVGEAMSVIAKRFLKEGKTPEETAALIEHPLEFVQACMDGRL